MYKLVSLKGITVPEGYAKGSLSDSDAVLYLMEIGMGEDAYLLLDSLKAITVPPGKRVITDRNKVPVIINAGENLPIHLGGTNDWTEFETRFVPDKTRNIKEKWKIEEVDKKTGEVIKPSPEDPDSIENFRTRMLLYREAVDAAIADKDFANAFVLLREAREEAGTLTDKDGGEYVDSVQNNLQRQLGFAMNRMVAGLFGRSKPEAPPIVDRSSTLDFKRMNKLRTEIVDSLEKTQDKLTASLSKAFPNTTWNYIVEKTKSTAEFGPQGLVGTFYRLLDKFTTTSEVERDELFLTMRESKDKTDVSALTAFLTISPREFTPDELNSMLQDSAKGYKVLPVSMLGIAEATRGVSKRRKLPPLEVVANILTSKLQKLQEDEKKEFKVAHRAGQVPAKTHRIVSQFNDLESFIDGYFGNSKEEVMNEVYSRGFFTKIWDSGTATMAQLSHGVNSTASVTSPVDNLGVRLGLAYRREGHKHMFNMTNSEDLATLEDIFGGPPSARTEELDLLFRRGNFPERQLNQTPEEFNRSIGNYIAGELGLTPSREQVGYLGNIMSDLYKRALIRDEFGHASILARIGSNFITDKNYTQNMANWVRDICGDRAEFDEYSQSFVGKGRVMPLAVMTYLPSSTEGLEIRDSAHESAKALLQENAMPTNRTSSPNNRLMKLLNITRARGINSGTGQLRSPLKGMKVEEKGRGELPDGYLQAQEDAMTSLFAGVNREDLYSVIRAVDWKNPQPGLLEEKQQSFGRAMSYWKDRLAGMNLPIGAAESLVDFAQGLIDPLGKGQTLGKFFEPVQMVATVAGLLSRGGVENFTLHQPEDPIEYGKLKVSPRGSLGRLTHMTFSDSSGRQNVIIPNVSNTGAVDLAHYIVSDDSIEVIPHEYKIGSGHKVAHIGNTDSFGFITKAVSGAFPGRTLNLHPPVNSSVKVPNPNAQRTRDTPSEIRIRDDVEYLALGSHINRSGPSLVPSGRSNPVQNSLDGLAEAVELSVRRRVAGRVEEVTEEERDYYVKNNLKLLLEGEIYTREEHGL